LFLSFFFPCIVENSDKPPHSLLSFAI
jgi:hypothetical protein